MGLAFLKLYLDRATGLYSGKVPVVVISIHTLIFCFMMITIVRGIPIPDQYSAPISICNQTLAGWS